jgi:protocatechuate 3,4-dioxygenase beta subunit
LRAGQYTLRETQPAGYLQGGQIAGSHGGDDSVQDVISRVPVGWGQRLTNYNFCELEPSSISGLVYVDGNGDCIRDQDEPPLAGVIIQLRDGDGKIVDTTSTNSDGRYTFANLRAGEYQVFEQQPDGYFQGGQVAGTGDGEVLGMDLLGVRLAANQDVVDYDFCELPPGSISGYVHVDTDGDCVRDEDEPPLAGVVIQLRDSDGKIVDTTTTNNEGHYLFDYLPPGDYQVFEQQPDGYFQGGQSVGTGVGRVLGIDLLGVTLSVNQDVTDYNFCELPPASISGTVWQETDLNQKFDPGESPVPGVLIELLDEFGETLQQMQTDSSGNYLFDSLPPGVYGIREHQPAGLFQGGELVGNSGGRVAQDDLIVDIALVGGNDAVHYDFPEVPPAKISGYVFQDGAAIVSNDPITAEELRNYRDGLLTEDDTRLNSVTLELRNILGQPFTADRALSGVYADGPIRVTTDADGYYEFVGLRPGTYHVYQVQPDEYIDGLDTPGSTGGVAVNPSDQLDDADKIVIQTLAASEATNPRDDAILNITLASGQASELNNFSEIVVTRPEEPEYPLLPPSVPEPPQRVYTPIEEFDPRVRIVAFAEPLQDRVKVYAIDEWAVSWHLSVINGGINRGTVGADGKIQAVSAKRMQQNWDNREHRRGKWMIADRDGNRTERGDGFDLGGEDAIALTGDFDGDGIDEAAIFVGGQWFVDLNGNGRWDTGDLWVGLGTKLDRPVVGDWDGDGKDDVGIFGRRWQRDEQKIRRDPGLPDPDNKRRREVDARTMAHRGEDQGDDRKRLMLRGDDGALKADAVDHVFSYGEQVDTPVAGDWNGDGIDQIAVFRNGNWLLDVDGDGRWTDKDEKVKFGRVGDEPIVGDFNGDEIDEIGVVRGDMWIIDTDGDRRLTGNDLQIRVPRGSENSQPIVGDFDGDGKDEPGYYDEAG